jgi:thiol-disulfide isomerase/thioredoxin
LPLPRPFAKQFAESKDETVDADQALKDVSETPYQDPFQADLPEINSVVDQVRPGVLREVTTVPIQSRDVTTEPTVDSTRSFTELVYILSNPGIAQGLSLLIDSPKEFKTKVMQYVYSNPSVLIEPKGMFARFRSSVPIYLFQNHYFAFVLMYNPYFDTLVKELDDEMLSHFKITSSLPSVISFLKQLRILIDTDPDLYQALVSIFKVNANQHYSFEAPPKVYAFTLLDLLLYEMLPLTVEKIKIMYPLFIDLVRNGARFSKIIYSDIVANKMPKSELKPLVEVTQFELQQQWEEATRRIDPGNELSQYNEQFRQTKHRLQDVNSKVNTQMQQLLEQQSDIVDQLADIKKRYREAVARLDPTQELSKLRVAYRKKINDNVYDYLFEHLVEYVPLDDLTLRQAHNALLKKIKTPEGELALTIGGLRGTSWKRSSLRQSSTKAARYRVSLYKGKRRTRANHS